MRKLSFVLLLIMISYSKYNGQINYTTDPIYDAVLVDEFDNLTLDTSKWRTHFPWGVNLFNTNVLHPACVGSAITDSTVQMAFMKVNPFDTVNRKFDTSGTGYMRLIHKRENYNGYTCGFKPNGDTSNPVAKSFKFTGAMAHSKKYIKYGHYEFRYRLKNVPAFNQSTYPNGDWNSYGPNFWMFTGDSSCYYSEIDVFEQNGVTWRLGSNMHMRKAANMTWNGILIPPPTGGTAIDTTFFHASNGNALPGSSAAVYGDIPSQGPFNGGTWHTVTCDWDDQVVKFTFDGQPGAKEFKKDSMHVDWLTNMPIILDCYAPSFQFCIPFDSTKTDMPFYYDIDYMKVYQQKQDCNPLSLLTTSAGSYQSKVYQNVTLGGTSGSAVFATGITHICGQDYVLLNEGFEVGSSTEVIIDNLACIPGQSIHQKPYSGPTTGIPFNNFIKAIDNAKKMAPHSN